MGNSEANYHNMIGESFIALRGWGFCLSPADLKLVDKWQELGVPVRIPLNVIADIQERRQVEVGAQHRIGGLSYIQEEVEVRFAELLEGHVGCGGCEQAYCGKRAAARPWS